jgi:hypothetical protein
MNKVLELLDVASHFTHKLSALHNLIYEYFTDHVYDEEYLSYLIALIDIFHYEDSANKFGIQMYQQTRDVRALIVYAVAENKFTRKYSDDTLSELLKNLETTNDVTIKCALLLLISDYYGIFSDFTGKEHRSKTDDHKYIYYINESIKLLPTPAAFLKLAEHKERPNPVDEANWCINASPKGLFIAADRPDKNKITDKSDYDKSVAQAYRCQAIDLFKTINPLFYHKDEKGWQNLNFPHFCDANIFEVIINTQYLKKYMIPGYKITMFIDNRTFF